MDNLKTVKFFEEVLSKTKDGKIRWQPTAVDNHFITALGGHFTLSLSQYTDEAQDFEYALVLKDQEGRILVRVASLDDSIEFRGLSELYETARRQALQVDDKIDQVLGELSKL